MIAYDEFQNDMRSESSKTLWLINQAIGLAKEGSEKMRALVKVRTTFESLNPAVKRQLNTEVMELVVAMGVKLKKDRDYLLLLADAGVTCDDVLPWTNQRLGEFKFLY